MNRPACALLLAVSLLTAACGPGASASAPAASQPPVASAAATSASPSIVASAEPSVAASGDGAGLCKFLQSELPALQKAGSTGGAVSVLAIDYANWIALDASRVLPDAAAMDTLTKAACPDVRTSILKVIGGDSFANSF